MRVAFFTNTPAHVHLYKHSIRRLRSKGHQALALARDYECTRDLLEYYDLPFSIYGSCADTKISLFKSLPRHFAGIARASKSFRPDIIFGMGAYSAFAGVVTNSPTVLILDSEPTTLDHRLSHPFARVILTPAAFNKHLGPKHYQFRGFKECAYLHPDEFTPDPSVRSELGVGPDERFAIVRFNAFGSHHDIGQAGFSLTQRQQVVDTIADHARVFVTGDTSGAVTDRRDVFDYNVHPARIHDTLYEATLLVADSQTMVTEAALLGTPAIRSNSFVGPDDMGNFLELERQGLVRNIGEVEDVLATATNLLTDRGVMAGWRARRDEYLSGLVNLTDIITDLATRDARIELLAEVQPYGSAAETKPAYIRG